MKLFNVYGGAYRRAVARQLFMRGEEGFAAAVGGNFEEVGAIERDILDAVGLPENGFVIDIGCGAGRLAAALKDRAGLSYLGLDVAPALLDRARQTVGRADWLFELAEGPRLPVEDASADMVAMFSVATHLPAAETTAYLKDAARALKPGGAAAVSFLDPALPEHAKQIRPAIVEAIATRLFWAPNVATSVEDMREIAAAAGLAAERIESPSPLGQSLAVLRKRV